MEKKICLWLLIISAFFTVSCFKGEDGPVGPAGQNGNDGQDGRNGLNGESVDKPGLSGLYRVYLYGEEPPLSKTHVDSSQFLFLSSTWTFRLYKLEQDSCHQINFGTVEWGQSALVITDSSKNSFFYSAGVWYDKLGSALTGTLPDLLNCAKCELIRAYTCSPSGK
jgi:hypothetical protein